MWIDMVSRLDATIYFNKKYLSLLNNIYTTVTAGSSRVHIYFHVQQKDLQKKSNVMRL